MVLNHLGEMVLMMCRNIRFKDVIWQIILKLSLLLLSMYATPDVNVQNPMLVAESAGLFQNLIEPSEMLRLYS